MKVNAASEPITAVLLVGGLGTRLRSAVPNAPKPLASVGDRPFLELLVRQLRAQGISRLMMCTGYRAGDIENEFGDGQALGVAIEYSKETEPLGTAGAIGLARARLRHLPFFLVMNGDSFLELDLHRLIRFHRDSGGLASLAAVRMAAGTRYGTVEVDAQTRVTAFKEKSGAASGGLVNAGVYVFSPAVLDHIPEGPSSLEKDVFPRLLPQGVYALERQGIFIDIGIPEDYARAQELSRSLYAAAFRNEHAGSGDPASR